MKLQCYFIIRMSVKNATVKHSPVADRGYGDYVNKDNNMILSTRYGGEGAIRDNLDMYKRTWITGYLLPDTSTSLVTILNGTTFPDGHRASNSEQLLLWNGKYAFGQWELRYVYDNMGNTPGSGERKSIWTMVPITK